MSANRPVRVALIGCGAIAPAHVEACASFPGQWEIVALCDIVPEKAEALKARFGLEQAVVADHAEKLLDLDFDLASVCTPPYTHAELAILFLRAGRHVIVEKPMAASLEECDRMLAAAADSGKVLSVIAQNRFRTPLMKLKRMLDSGLAGKLLHVQVDSHWWRGYSYYDLWWRGTWEKEGGGCTINHAVHHIDAMLWMAGMPVEVQAYLANTAHDNAEVEDLSVAIFRYADGALGQLTSSVVHHGEEQQLVFQCSGARISAPWRPKAGIAKPNGFPEPNPELERKLQEAYDAIPDLEHEGHAGQYADVLNAIRTGGKPLIGGEDGRRTLEFITAVYKAGATGQAVRLPLAPDDPFYTREGILARAVKFYEKKRSVEGFAPSGDITTGSDYR
ncbi:putative dehydrogenase [Thermobacillus composti KWC4]|uniref:Putative dehydrogenase n=1 Tax=Thermobacillus composti (strain DSM 18247 / JCM 13945 / KWC4) TaxID=717605 RepID=L0EI87_THECK|nr:Gfo/Idh/MocA family oxidoreductase [Thermobacillus composti]AGA58865.1 putative dehydrogenase [Thermobacillus composti KWC4]